MAAALVMCTHRKVATIARRVLSADPETVSTGDTLS